MKLLNERIGLLLPDGTRNILDRAAHELRVRQSDYIRAAISNQLRADGYLDTGRKLTAKLKSFGRIAA
jgi:phage baseplate assembly protein gpV